MATSRKRISSDITSTNRPDTRTVSYVDGAPTVSINYRRPLGTYRETTDVVTPNFQELIQRGHIVNNPFGSLRSVVTASDKAGEIQRTTAGLPSGTYYKSNWSRLSGLVCNPTSGDVFPVPSQSYSDLDTIAFTSAMAGAGAPDIQALVSLGEAKQTLGLLVKPLKAIYEILKYPQRFGDGYTRWRNWPEFWLMYRYGVIPLLMDIQGTLKALSRVVNARVRETSRSSERDNGSKQFAVNYSDAQISLAASVQQFEQYEVRAGVLYQHDATLASQFGATPLNLTSTAWELVPWSFVYDWLMNTGELIKALEAVARVSPLAAWTSSTLWVQQYYSCDSFNVSGAAAASGWVVTKSCVGGSAVGDYRVKARIVRTAADLGLRGRVKLTPKRVVDAVALVLTNLRVK